jgi:hypothetical protein
MHPHITALEIISDIAQLHLERKNIIKTNLATERITKKVKKIKIKNRPDLHDKTKQKSSKK